jgi:hypothetical protein
MGKHIASRVVILCVTVWKLLQVNYLPLSVLVTAFKKESVQRPLEGFGVLVPSNEQENGLKTLGELSLHSGPLILSSFYGYYIC